MQTTNIEWTDYSWNPIKGLCPVDCKLPDGRGYCYARRIYLNRNFKWSPEIRFVYENLKRYPVKPRKIFVCSTMEIFHPLVKKEWRGCIFTKIRKHPEHTFQILTKLPQNIDREMPDNVWLGVSLTGAYAGEDFARIRSLELAKAKVKFASYEPLLNKTIYGVEFLNWIIIGRLTGFGNKYNPKLEWINEIAKPAIYDKIPIFLKNNLKNIWPGPLIQEFPE